MSTKARYDDVADFYATSGSDNPDDAVSNSVLRMLGDIAGKRVLDVACGHGPMTRELARRNASVVGVDVSDALIRKAEASERGEHLGIRYIRADIAERDVLQGETFDAVICSFGLSDIDDLDGALATVHRTLRPDGEFVFSILHPCFPGGEEVSGSWPTNGHYGDEGWWRADGSRSTLRRQVGANHRTLATYVNTLHRHGLVLDEIAEPPPSKEWAATRPDAARAPVFLVARCTKRSRRLCWCRLDGPQSSSQLGRLSPR